MAAAFHQFAFGALGFGVCCLGDTAMHRGDGLGHHVEDGQIRDIESTPFLVSPWSEGRGLCACVAVSTRQGIAERMVHQGQHRRIRAKF